MRAYIHKQVYTASGHGDGHVDTPSFSINLARLGEINDVVLEFTRKGHAGLFLKKIKVVKRNVALYLQCAF